jgi:N-acetylmuramoyl-L-alanine amidase
MKNRIWITLFLLVLPIKCLCAGSYVLTTASGDTIGRLPFMERGDEQLIPLAVLASKAEWTTETSSGVFTMTAPNAKVDFRRGNSFVKVNDAYRQLSLAPEEWDGSLWVYLSGLSELLPSECFNLMDSIQTIVILRMPAEAKLADTSATTVESDTLAWRLKTVIIDPGHGGKDPGAVGLHRIEEKILTLDIAKRLADQLRASGLAAELTRQSDRFVPLSERTSFANAQRGDLFVSIHVNSSRDTSSKGIETYFLKPARTQRAVDAAMRENSVVEFEDQTADYKELTDQNYILMTMATSQYMKDSEKWAALSLEHAKRKTGLTARGVDQAGFYVLIGASMPAILFECGFLSNPGDAALLSSEVGKQKVAEALGESILLMKSELEASAIR